MFSLEDQPIRLCDGVNRREWLRVGGLSVLGLSLPELLRSKSEAAPSPGMESRLTKGLQGATFGRAKSVIFLWLQGGPPQHETFDPKPDAPAEIRGPFKPIATNVPGIQISELLPRVAKQMDKLSIVRSMHTEEDNHPQGTYYALTGHRPNPAMQFPSFGSIISKEMGARNNLPPYVLTPQWDKERQDRKSTRLNSSHIQKSRMPSSA